MRIHVDLKSHVAGSPAIIQVERTPSANDLVAINGKFVIPTPPGVEFAVDTSSYVLDGAGDVDGQDVTSVAFAYLLAQYPQYSYLYFNPLLTAAHVEELDETAQFKDNSTAPPTYFDSRFQSGRSTGGAEDGQMPTHTAIHPQNNTVTPARPGVLITDEIDLTSYVPSGEPGFQDFMLYWRLQAFADSMDVASDYGAFAGQNEAAVRFIQETDQEPSGLAVYLSPDNGDHWCAVSLLSPISLTAATKKIRLAFLNTGTSRIYLAHFAVFF
jgi:hypothetical protein